MGNSLFPGQTKQFGNEWVVSHRLHPVVLLVEDSEITLHEADQPGVAVDFADANVLTGEDGAQVDLLGPVPTR